jgi:hypothetical protein
MSVFEKNIAPLRKLLCFFLLFTCFFTSAQNAPDSFYTEMDSIHSQEDANLNEETAVDQGTEQSVVLRSVPDSVLRRMRKEKDFLYANDSSYWIKKKQPEKKSFIENLVDFLGRQSVKTTIYILLACVLLFAIYRMIVINNLYVFYSPGKQKPEDDEIPNAMIDDVELDEKIETAEKNSDFRLAVRFRYLKTLHLLNAKNWINYHAKATNNDYVNQMHPHKQLNEFQFLTRAYEYVWYGDFKLNESQYLRIRTNFNDFYKSVA